MLQPLDKNELVELLTPLVIPMIRDMALVSYPIPGHNGVACVRITHGRYDVQLPPDQYEIFRTEVLQYVQDRLGSHPGLMYAGVALLIKSRLQTVFADA